MDFLKVNQTMFEQRLAEKKSGKFSQIPINKDSDGFSMLTKKEITSYVDLLEHVHIKTSATTK